MDSFVSMGVLIDTDRFDIIDADLILTIDDSGYRIKIKEAGPTVQVLQENKVPGSYSPMADRDSNHGVVGFGDLDNEVALGDDVECRHWSGFANMEVVHNREEVNESPGIQTDLNMLKGSGRPVDSPLMSSYSQSRTPTVCFSQNGF